MSGFWGGLGMKGLGMVFLGDGRADEETQTLLIHSILPPRQILAQAVFVPTAFGAGRAFLAGCFGGMAVFGRQGGRSTRPQRAAPRSGQKIPRGGP